MAKLELEDLDRLYRAPGKVVLDKVLDHVDAHGRSMIALSPFCVVSAAGPDGRLDVSPRGGEPGFIHVSEDGRALFLPDRPGNNRLDTLSNLLVNDGVGLLFLVPGVCETLRVNGRARVVTGDELLAPTAVRGRLPTAGILVAVEEVYLHCAKALMRSKLWQDDHKIERRELPSLGQMLADQIAGLDAAEADARVEDSIRNRLY